jgi:hypothetical protein
MRIGVCGQVGEVIGLGEGNAGRGWEQEGEGCDFHQGVHCAGLRIAQPFCINDGQAGKWDQGNRMNAG